MDEIGFLNFAVDNFYLQILSISLLFCWKFEKKKYFYLRLIPLSLLGLGIFFLYPKIAVGWLNFSFALIFVANIVLLKFCFKIQWKQIGIYNIAAAALQNLVAKLITIFFAFGALQHLERSLLQLAITDAVYIAFSVAFYFFYIKRTKERGMLEVSHFTFCFLLVVTVAVVFVLSTLIDVLVADVTSRILAMSLLIVIDAMVLFAEFGVFEKSNLEKESEMMESLLSMQKDQQQRSEQNIDLINRKCHDMRHQISLLKAMNDSEENRKYIAGLEESLKLYDLDIETGNKVLDIVLSESQLRCEKNQIRFTYMIDGASMSFMDSSDCYVLFGNALENATEALCKEEDVQKRILTANVKKEKNCVVVHIENYYSGPPLAAGRLPRTTKEKNGYHGFGLKSIKYVTEKYGGNLSVFTKRESFVLQAVFLLAD